MLLCGSTPPDMHFLLEEELALDDDDLLDDRHNRYIAVFTNRRCGFNETADRHVLDFDTLVRQRFIDLLIPCLRDSGHANHCPLDHAARDSDLFDLQRKHQFFFLKQRLAAIDRQGVFWSREGRFGLWLDHSFSVSRTESLAPPTAF